MSAKVKAVTETKSSFYRVIFDFDKYGQKKIYAFKNNELESSSLAQASRDLTGSTGESGAGIFSQTDSEKFYYGEYSKSFKLDSFIFDSASNQDEKNLKQRILAVREWVQECKEKQFRQEIILLPVNN